jgi:hypothetical protein
VKDIDRKTFDQIVRAIGADAELGPHLEALGWILAEHLPLTDSIGGTEWRQRVEDGSVSPAALAVLKSVIDEA